VVIVLIAGASALLSSILNMAYWNNNDGQNYLDFSVISLLLSVIRNLFQNFVLIAVIFFVGKRLGANTNFRKTFSVMSYCLIPVIIGIIVIPVAMTFVSQMSFSGIGGGTIDLDSNLSPSYALDFASSVIISNGFTIFFGAWTLVLFLKAIKTVNGFDTKKSIITVASGIVIMFLSQMAFAIPSSLLFHL
jgi:hypothetical protein